MWSIHPNKDFTNADNPGTYYNPQTHNRYPSEFKGSPSRDLWQAVTNGVHTDWDKALQPNKIDRIFFTGLYFLASIPWYLLKFAFKVTVILGFKLIKFIMSTSKQRPSGMHYRNPNMHRYYRR